MSGKQGEDKDDGESSEGGEESSGGDDGGESEGEGGGDDAGGEEEEEEEEVSTLSGSAMSAGCLAYERRILMPAGFRGHFRCDRTSQKTLCLAFTRVSDPASQLVTIGIPLLTLRLATAEPSSSTECENSKECSGVKHHFEECQKRVSEGNGFKGEDCMEEL